MTYDEERPGGGGPSQADVLRGFEQDIAQAQLKAAVPTVVRQAQAATFQDVSQSTLGRDVTAGHKSDQPTGQVHPPSDLQKEGGTRG